MTNDFTEKRYAELLDLATSRFSFHLVSDIPEKDNIAIWRHDIDFSPQNALNLAYLEHERDIKATYFVQLSSLFYSPFDTKVISLIKEIRKLGHEIGLHFDPSIYTSDKCDNLLNETKTLENLLEIEIHSFSLHNPTTYDNSLYKELEVHKLHNASSPILRDRFSYCSDSNGIWRFTPLKDMITDPDITNLYVLTHPIWWSSESSSPREKVVSNIRARGEANLNYYDNLLEHNQRPNIGK